MNDNFYKSDYQRFMYFFEFVKRFHIIKKTNETKYKCTSRELI